MLRIREGNKFTWAWAIVRGAENVDLSTATNIKFSYQFKDKAGRVNITEFTLAGNIITTKFLFNGVQGIVNLRLVYELPVIGLCTVDIDAFEIVASSEEASEGGEFSMTSDMAIALQGKNAYEVWLETHTGTLEDYEAWLKQPASDAANSIALIEDAVEQNEAIRLQSEINRSTAEGLRVAAEGVRQANEQTRQDAEDSRDTAETARGNNETARQTKETERQQAETTRGNNETERISAETNRGNNETIRQTKETERQQAETTRGNNEAARISAETTRGQNETTRQTQETERVNSENDRKAAELNRQPSIINNEQVQAETYNVLNARIAALEALLTNGVYNYVQAENIVAVQSLKFKGAEMILTGTTAPSVVPDFVGQFYINTTAGTTYQAKGIVNASDWKQTSN